MSSPHIIAIIPAGGKGTRMNAEKPKQFMMLHDEPVLIKSLKALNNSGHIKKFYIPTVDIVYTRKLIKNYAPDINIEILKGGKTRQESIHNALDFIVEKNKENPSENPMPDYVLVHDAVRALVQKPIIDNVIRAAIEVGGAIAASPVTNTLKQGHSINDETDTIKKNLPRDGMWRAQTPQVFKTEIMIEAYDKAKVDKFEGTDSAGLIERLSHPVQLVASPTYNMKITTLTDLKVAEVLFPALPKIAEETKEVYKWEK